MLKLARIEANTKKSNLRSLRKRVILKHEVTGVSYEFISLGKAIKFLRDQG